MIGQIRIESLRLEGDLFKLLRKLDKEKNATTRYSLREEIHNTKTRLLQYQNLIDAFEKQETLKRIKRKMLR